MRFLAGDALNSREVRQVWLMVFPPHGKREGQRECPRWVRFRLPVIDKAGTKGWNAPKADRKWPRAENGAC
jgi:hypothetical protein